MAAVLAVLEAYAVLEQVNNIFTAARDRIVKCSNNPNLAQSLASLFQRLQKELAPLADQCHNNTLQLSEHDLDFFTVRIGQLKESMLEIRKTLQEKTKRLKNPLYRISRALTTSNWLSELENTARRADQLLLDIKPFFITANLIHDVRHLVATQGEQQDVFHPSFDVPENPSHVVLNIQSISEMEQDDASQRTLESKLKWAVLQSDGSQSIGAVGSRSPNSVGVEGMSGVGKSCAMRGLAKDAEVLQRFQQGIYFMILGKDATEADVVQQIANILSTSGGTRLAREVSGEASVGTAISKAKNWFTGRRCLLLIDDVWEESGSGRDIVARLSRLVDVAKGSRVVFTTRDVRMALRSDAIRFSGRDLRVSLQMLLSSAGLEETDIEPCRMAVENVLQLCGGIPMALAVTGSAIRVRLCSADESTMTEVMGEYLSGLEKHRGHLLRRTVDNDAYGNLASAFRASLLMLDDSMSSKLPFECAMRYSEMYRALAVLRRQGWLPLNVLGRLWETGDAHEAEEVLQGLVEANLAQREHRFLDDKRTLGISLHDLQLDFVLEECKRYGELEKWHRKVLSSFLPEPASSSSESCGNFRNWCRDEVLADEYMRKNACRHMTYAGLEGELCRLLWNPKWATVKLRSREALELEEEFGMVLEGLCRERQKNATDLQPGGEEWSLKMIAGAAKLSAAYVSANPKEVWFQLYARLRRLSKRSWMIEKYIADIEQCAERPWVKALSACLPEPGGALQSTTLCDGYVRCMSVGGGGRLFVCGTQYRVPFVSTLFDGEVEKTVFVSRGEEGSRSSADLGSLSESEEGVCSSAEGQSSSDAVEKSSDSAKGTSEDISNGDVSSAGSPMYVDNTSAACCNRDGTRAVLGYRDGLVQLWNAETGEMVGNPLRRHEGEVRCVALSADGNFVASGSEDMTVRIWDANTGESVGGALCEHRGGVRCVAWSEDGKRLASGSRDGTVLVWNVETGEAVFVVEISREESYDGAPDESRDRTLSVERIAWSADGKLLASGTNFKTVRVWNAETGEPVCKSLRGHTDWVSCVALSADGKQVVSGSHDGTVRVWDAGTGEAVGNAQRGHSDWVTCVAWSEDGKRVFSGSDDWTVRVWDIETDGVEDVPMTGLKESVYGVVFSEDGKRLVCLSFDGTLRIWDTKTGEAIGDALRGHDSWVVSVLWSVDGKRVASASDDGTARLWDSVTSECLKVEDRGSDDVSQLRSLLGDEAMVSEDREEEKDNGDELIDTYRGKTVRYLPAGNESVLATLEGDANWAYSKVGRKIAARKDNGTVALFELVV